MQILVDIFSPDIICFQEANFKNNHLPTLKYFNNFFKIRINESYASGKAIIPSDISKLRNTDLDAAAVSISFPNVSTSVMPIFQTVSLLDFQHLVELIAQLLVPLIMSGDFAITTSAVQPEQTLEARRLNTY